MWLMFRYYLFFGVIDVLKWLMFEDPPAWSMFWCGWCFGTVYFFGVVDVSKRLMFEIPQRISLANTDVWGPSGKKYNKTSWSLSMFSPTWSMFCCGLCFGIIYFFGVIDVLKRLMFEGPPAWLMFWCGWCFGTVYFLVWLMFWSGWFLRSLRAYRSPTLMFEVPQGKIY